MTRPTLNMDITKLILAGQFDAVVNELTPFTLLQGSARRSFCDRHQKPLVHAFHACCKQGKHKLIPMFLTLVRGERSQAIKIAADNARPLAVKALLDEVDDKARGAALMGCLGSLLGWQSWKDPKDRELLLACVDLLLGKGVHPIENATKACLKKFDTEIYALLITSNNFNDEEIHATFNDAARHGNAMALALLIAQHKPEKLPPRLLTESLKLRAVDSAKLLLPLCDHAKAIDLFEKRFAVEVSVLSEIAEDLSFEACQKLLANKHQPLPPGIKSRLEAKTLRSTTPEAPMRARARL